MTVPNNDLIKVALVGNPNSGKTTLFNRITGAHAHTANYPGVTVDSARCRFEHRGLLFDIYDLPGIYSLGALSEDERIARDFIFSEKPAVVVDIIDASHLEHNLYLTTQLLEMDAPLVLALNKSDLAEAAGLNIDLDLLGAEFGAPAVFTIGTNGKGTEDLIDSVFRRANGWVDLPKSTVDYGTDIDAEIDRLQRLIPADDQRARWMALKLLENDPQITGVVAPGGILPRVDESIRRLTASTDKHPRLIIPERRYAFIAGACKKADASRRESADRLSDRLDSVLTHPLLGIPIFLALMFVVFQITFTLGQAPMNWINSFFDWLGSAISGHWAAGSDSALRSLLVDGVIGGVGGVIVFLPNIMLLFAAIAALELSGYMPRAAFLMDRLMHRIGLHGKSFIPMLIGFGCTIPAIMATRTLDNRRDRLTTILVLPLMSCGARLPIYALIIPAFFPPRLHGPMLWTIYVIGIVLAILGAKLLRRTVLRGPESAFVMELPPYRIPSPLDILRQMWERAVLYLRKAGTIILGISIILWALTNYPRSEVSAVDPAAAQSESLAHSYAGRIGGAIEPVIGTMGFDWRIGTAFIGAFAAKEVFVAQMGIVFAAEAGGDQATLRQKLAGSYSPLVGFCILLFSLITSPCMATVAVTVQESKSWKWAGLQFGGLTLLAYSLTTAVYQIGSLLNLGV